MIPLFEPPSKYNLGFTFYEFAEDKLYLTFQEKTAPASPQAYAQIDNGIQKFNLTNKYTQEQPKAVTRDEVFKYWANIKYNDSDSGRYSRAYEAVYVLTPNVDNSNLKGKLATELFWTLFNRQTGIGRADNVTEQKTNPDEKMDYRWEFVGDFDGDTGFKKKLAEKITELYFGIQNLKEGNNDEFKKAFETFKTQAAWKNFKKKDLGDLIDIDSKKNLGTLTKEVTQSDEEKKTVSRITQKNQIKSSLGFHYQFFSEEQNGENDDLWFVQCNTPYVPTGFNTSFEENAEKRLKEFQFAYYRKVSSAPVEGDDTHDFKTKVIKAPDGKNRPTDKDITETDGYIGLSLPISMNLLKNQTAFKTAKTKNNTSKWKVIKNKGNCLEAEKAQRKQAGSIMDKIRKHIKKTLESKVGGSKTSLSATKFSEAVVGQPAAEGAVVGQPAAEGNDTNKAQKEWQELKQTKQTIFPTAQEWCHLLGHGDGGDERVGNFVSGSYHCNTEQLAIESGQRRTTIPATNRYILKSTAYLLNDDSMEEQSGQTYLNKNDSNYKENGYKKNPKKPMDEVSPTKTKIEGEIKATGKNAPIAKFIRYKIYDTNTKDAKGQPVKIFDYIFEGQSEFFDRNQYLILNYTIRYILNPDEVLEDLAQKWIEKNNLKRKSSEPSKDDKPSKKKKSEGGDHQPILLANLIKQSKNQLIR